MLVPEEHTRVSRNFAIRALSDSLMYKPGPPAASMRSRVPGSEESGLWGPIKVAWVAWGWSRSAWETTRKQSAGKALLSSC